MEQAKIWNHYQSADEKGGVFAHATPRLDTLFEMLKGKGDVLNIGVGSGYFEKRCHNAGMNIYATDLSDDTIAQLQRDIPVEGRFFKATIDKLPFADQSFDYVVASEVLEHLDDASLAAGLREIRRVLVAGGQFIGTVPADENLKESETMCPDCGKVFHRWGHAQSFSPARMKELLERTGLRHVESGRRLFIAFGPLNWKGKLNSLLQMALFALGLKKSGLNLLFTGMR